MVNKAKISPKGLIIDKSRATTAKTRVIAHQQHVIRIDKESKEYVPKAIEDKIFSSLKNNINKLDAIILQDYNKGVLSPKLIEKIIARNFNAEII